MEIKKENIIKDNNVNLVSLLNLSKKPELFSAGEDLFWDDPHISRQMLEAHLNPDCDAASRKHDNIDRSVNWLVGYMKQNKGARLLDLGCGPGLYCTRLFKHGFNVVGMDYSKNSINYAVKYSVENSMDIQYIYQNYLTMDYTNEFDAILMIYCDFGALTDSCRDILLKKIHKALKPNGIFIFDVFTRFNREQPAGANWYVCESGFWRPYPHMVLEQSFHYVEENVFLNQHIIIDRDGNVAVYKIWDHYYSKETISKLMKEHGFQVQDVWEDLTGKPLGENSKSLAIAVRKL